MGSSSPFLQAQTTLRGQWNSPGNSRTLAHLPFPWGSVSCHSAPGTLELPSPPPLARPANLHSENTPVP